MEADASSRHAFGLRIAVLPTARIPISAFRDRLFLIVSDFAAVDAHVISAIARLLGHHQRCTIIAEGFHREFNAALRSVVTLFVLEEAGLLLGAAMWTGDVPTPTLVGQSFF